MYTTGVTPKPKKIRITKVYRVALVDEGANLIPGLRKSKGGDATADAETGLICPLTKVSADRGLLYSIVYAPMMLDAHGHYMTAEDIETACNTFGEEGMQLDIMHGEDALDRSRAAVVQNFILGGLDKRFPTEDHLGREVQHEGAWAMVTKIHDPALRQYTEFSLACRPGEYAIDDNPPEGELALLKGKDTNEPMDAETKAAIDALTKSVADLTALTKSAIDKTDALEKGKDAPKPEDKPKPGLTLADLRKAKVEITRAKILKHYGVDTLEEAVVALDAEQLGNLEEDLAELEKSLGGTGGGVSGRFFSKSRESKGNVSGEVELAADGLPVDPAAREEAKAEIRKQAEAFNKSRRVGARS